MPVQQGDVPGWIYILNLLIPLAKDLVKQVGIVKELPRTGALSVFDRSRLQYRGTALTFALRAQLRSYFLITAKREQLNLRWVISWQAIEKATKENTTGSCPSGRLVSKWTSPPAWCPSRQQALILFNVNFPFPIQLEMLKVIHEQGSWDTGQPSSPVGVYHVVARVNILHSQLCTRGGWERIVYTFCHGVNVWWAAGSGCFSGEFKDFDSWVLTACHLT